MNKNPIVQDIVLVGGGHSHALLIRKWAMQPLPGVRLTLISENVLTPYSGMLPGLVAGHYSHKSVHIDLLTLCQWAGVRFIKARLEAINLEQKTLALNDARPPVEFDVLSLDTGSTPELNVPGSAEHSVAVKPVHAFYARWHELEKSVNASKKPMNIGVVGSGAGGFELLMSMQYALPKQNVRCHWIIRGQSPLKNRPSKVQRYALEAAKAANIEVHTGFDVVKLDKNLVYSKDKRSLEFDELVWCTAARAPSWPELAGLNVDRKGFVYTNEYLQSVSHPFVFATGDIGTQQQTPSEKAGVFAVRQAPVLFNNLRAYVLSKKLKTYTPQRDFLSLMATGSKSAIASRNRFSVSGAWVWHWKNAIDQKFMKQFVDLPKLNMAATAMAATAFTIPKALLDRSSISTDDIAQNAMRCKGCGAKVASSVLDTVLNQLKPVKQAGIVAGFDAKQDTAIVDASSGLLVQSVDQLSAMIDEPYLFGRIAAVHALSDIYTTNATAHSAQAILTVPFADKTIMQRDLSQLMAGAVDSLNADNCTLIGGHSAEGEQTQLGFVVNGFINHAENITVAVDSDAAVGDALVLTKALGTGILLAGMMQQLSVGEHVYSAIESMLQSNKRGAELLKAHGAKVMTDVTGFGLLGHALRMLENPSHAAQIVATQLPVLPGVTTLAAQKVSSSLLSANQSVLNGYYLPEQPSEEQQSLFKNIACDPQTSGGLLAVVPIDNLKPLLTELHAAGYCSAAQIGTVVDSGHTFII